MIKSPILVIDLIIEKDDKIVLIKRRNEPYKGKLALPGGKVEVGERVEETTIREAKEETSLDVELTDIMGVYSDKNRDPRWPSASIVFIAKPIRGELKCGSDAEGVFWFNPDEIDLNEVAFDHKKIISDYLKWKKRKETYWSTK